MKMSYIPQLGDPKKMAFKLIQMKPREAQSTISSILAKITDPVEAAALLQALHDETKNLIEECNAEITELELLIETLDGENINLKAIEPERKINHERTNVQN